MWLPTPAAQRRHDAGASNLAGYSSNGLRGLVSRAFDQLQGILDLTDDERRHLAGSTPHALRHTFGTQVVATVPPDVAQKVLGHGVADDHHDLCTGRDEAGPAREQAGYFE